MYLKLQFIKIIKKINKSNNCKKKLTQATLCPKVTLCAYSTLTCISDLINLVLKCKAILHMTAMYDLAKNN